MLFVEEGEPIKNKTEQNAGKQSDHQTANDAPTIWTEPTVVEMGFITFTTCLFYYAGLVADSLVGTVPQGTHGTWIMPSGFLQRWLNLLLFWGAYHQ